MDEREVQELENPENWDFENRQRHEAVKKPRAVVSVAFSREDFERIEEQAERLGITLSKFIRDAALEKAASVEAGSGLSGKVNLFVTFLNEPLQTKFVWYSKTPSIEESGSTAIEGRQAQLSAS
jgi:hypothetical protein